MLRLRYTIFVAALFLALLLSATNTVSASADEVVPPAEETTSSELPPMEGETEEVTSAEEEVAEEGSDPGADSEQDPSTEPLLEQLPSDPEQDLSTEPLLEQLPENTELVVLDENGEPLPLASQEAAEILAASDPQWCPTGTTPGSLACSGIKTSFNGTDPLNNLIEWLKQNQPAKAGVIWIEASYNSTTAGEGGPVILDGLDFTSMDNFALTINGGWTGTGTALNPNTPSTFNVPFSIINWNAAVTINNIVVNAASGAGTAALTVTTTGNIVINNVDVTDNVTDNGGAYLDNTAGVGTVTVNDASFNGSTQSHGLSIYSRGAVTLKNVNALGNSGNGANIDNSTAASAAAVTLTGFNNFSQNLWDGLGIRSKGVVTLTNTSASYNLEGSGGYIDNTFGSPTSVILKGVNTFNGNGWDGLRIYSMGLVTINSVSANNNGTDPNRDPANYIGPGDDEIQGTPDDEYDGEAYGKGLAVFNWANSPKPVTLTGTNMFNGNASTGLFIDSNGLVKLNNLTASFNACDPLYDIDDSYCAGAYIQGGGITQTGYGTFVGNAAQGLEVYNAYVPSVNTNVGAIALVNIYATDNGEGGVMAMTFGNTSYNVSITGSNVFTDNLNGEGLYVWSNGVVSLSNVTAKYNDSDGVYINNTSAKSPRAVTFTGVNVFTDNGGTGLYVSSNGAITTNNVTSNFNDGDGVFLNNCGWDWGLLDCTGLRPDNGVMLAQPVSMNGINNTGYNGWNGTWIVSLGVIKFSSFTSDWNQNLGAYFYNAFNPAVTVGVTQTGYASFSNNLGLSGFNIFSTGVVSLTNVTANVNQTFGGVIQNHWNNLKPVDVILNGFNTFNENGSSGLAIDSFGTVTLNNITANLNGYGGTWTTDEPPVFVPYPGPHSGVAVNNSTGSVARAVILNGTNTFNYNNGTGLSVVSRGEIKATKVTANFNADSGAVLDNYAATLNLPVTLFGYGSFHGNGADGLSVSSHGTITTNNITSLRNDGYGVELFNESVNATPVAVAMLGVNTFTENLFDGLNVMTDGLITLYNLNANDNGQWGAYLDNVTLGTLSASRGMVLYGTNNFMNNQGGGLYFESTGSVILNRVNAAMNDDGVFDANFSRGIMGSSTKDITLACVVTFMNEGDGYYLDAGNLLTLNAVLNYGSSSFYDAASVLVMRTCTLP